MSKERISLLVDANSLCHKAKHTLGELNYETARVGIIFGFFMQILKAAKEFSPDDLAFFWDSQKSHRLKIYPSYKESRRNKKDKTPEELEEDKLAFKQFDLLHEKYLPQIGFKNNYKESGFEADDLIASTVNENMHKLIIMSGDEDLYQCLYNDVYIYKNGKLFGQKEFLAKYEIDIADWWLVKAIAGCTSDDIKGIRGVGETKAIKYIKSTLPRHHLAYLCIIAPEGKEIIRRNKQLVQLPFKGTPPLLLEKDEVLSLDGFMDMCKELGFEYFLKKDTLSQFKKYLKLR